MRIAFFGGSFDPPHLGHVAVARAARNALGLDRVLFAPVGFQPLKPLGSAAGFEDRVAMTRLAIQNEPAFELSLADAPVPGNPAPNYTIDTLTNLRRAYPPQTEWFLLLGADAFLELPHWYRGSEIPFLAHLIVASRPHSEGGREDLTRIAHDHLPGVIIEPVAGRPNHYRLSNDSGAEARLTVLPHLDYDISATELRSHLHSPQIAPAVLEYIRQHHLYE